jgi:hypothetical protein
MLAIQTSFVLGSCENDRHLWKITGSEVPCLLHPALGAREREKLSNLMADGEKTFEVDCEIRKL